MQNRRIKTLQMNLLHLLEKHGIGLMGTKFNCHAIVFVVIDFFQRL